MVLGAVVLGLALVPRGLERVALREGVGDNAAVRRLLERRTAGGDRAPATLGALARLQLRTGDAAGAADLLSELSASRPQDGEVLRLLARAQRAAGRLDAAVATLERLRQRAPDAATLHELAQLHRVRGDAARERHVLVALIQDHGAQAWPQDALRLAGLHTTQGAPALALELLGRLARLRCDAVDIAQYGGALVEGGRPDLAATFVEPWIGSPPDPLLLVLWARASAAGGRAVLALERLEPVAGRPGANAELRELRLSLALDAGRFDRVHDALQHGGADGIAAPLLERIGTAAVAAGRADILASLRARYEAALAAQSPALAARIAQAVGDAAAARRHADAALARADAATPQLGAVLEALGDRAGVLALLQRAEGAGAPGDWVRLALRQGRPDLALDLLDRRRSPAQDADLQAAHALAAAAAGRGAEVLDWLDVAPPLPPAFYRDLLHVAMDAGQPRVAARAGARLAPADRDHATALRHVQALLDSGQAAAAVDPIEELRASRAIDADRHIALLQQARHGGAVVAAPLRRALLERLAAAQAVPQQRAGDVSALLELGVRAELLPRLEPWARRDPQRWLAAFNEAARDQPARAHALWQALAADAVVPRELRLQLTHRLLESGRRDSAESILRDLASAAGPDDPATRQLLHLWGERPGAAALDWLAARAAASRGAERAGWLRRLSAGGGALRAVALASGQPDDVRGDGPAFDEAYLEAAEHGGDPAVLARTLREIGPRTSDAQRLARLAKAAAGSGDAALERERLEAALNAGAADPQLARALGLSAWRAGDAPKAERWLGRYVGAGTAAHDWVVHLALGELRRQRRDAAGARDADILALQALDAGGERGWAARRTRAALLQRLGRDGEAQRLREDLLAARPQDDNLRADAVALSLERGDTAAAWRLLEGRPR